MRGTDAELTAAILRLLASRRRSAGDLTRALMGLGLLSKLAPAMAYDKTKFLLLGLLSEGAVTKAGNGKSVHWKLVAPARSA